MSRRPFWGGQSADGCGIHFGSTVGHVEMGHGGDVGGADVVRRYGAALLNVAVHET